MANAPPNRRPSRGIPGKNGFGKSNRTPRINPKERLLLTGTGYHRPADPYHKLILAREAQVDDALERGMSPSEAHAYASTLRVHPNRRRGLPNVVIPNAENRKWIRSATRSKAFKAKKAQFKVARRNRRGK